MEKIRKFIRSVRWRNLPLLTLAGIINAAGVTFFLYPVKLYDSGISGTSMMLAQITPEAFTLSLFLLVLNVPLFLFGLRRQGGEFTFFAVYTVCIYSVSALVITHFFPLSGASPLAGCDLLLCAVFGGIISGTGSGLAIRFGGAMDGVEVMAVIFAKRIGITVGTFVMIYNVALYIICGIILSSWVLPLYSIITYAAALKTVDFIVEGFDRSKAAMIITCDPDGICAALSEEFGTGMTVLNARGGYSGTEKNIVYFVVNRFEVVRMKDIVHRIDPSAYITINEVADVFASNQDKT